MKKNIYINARFLTQKLTGVQRYAYEISKSLAEKNFYNIILLVPRKKILNRTYLYNFNIIKVGLNRSHFWEQLDLLLFLNNKNKPLLVNLTNSGPVFYKNQISTIHDLSIYRSGNWYSSIYKMFYRMIIPKLINNSIKVLTVSEFSKNEIIRKFNISNNKVQVIHNAVSLNLDYKKIKNTSNEEYILFIGGSSERKNLLNTLKAFNQIENKSLRFKIVGFNKKYSKYIKDKNIDIYDKVDDCILNKLYSNARLLIFPSFYEGFGIPPIEAMHLRCPVIVSNIPVFKDLFEDSVIFVDPHSVDEIKKSIIELLDNSALRQELIVKGLKQSRKFSWKISSSKLVDIINQL